VVNKIDRSDARPQEVLDEVFDLFVNLTLGRTIDFPVLFASGAMLFRSESDVRSGDLSPLFETIIRHFPPHDADPERPVPFPRDAARPR